MTLATPPAALARSSSGASAVAAWPTPKKLKAYRFVVWALVGVLLVLGELTLATSGSAFKTIGTDTVPSIIAAEEIGYALADLDANVANALLGNAQHRRVADAAIEKERVRVTDSLVDAAQNITYGDAEKVPIRAMVRDLGLYLERVAEARLRFELGDSSGARASYWAATDLLHKRLLSEANDLDAANKAQLDAAYQRGGDKTRGAEILILVVGAVLTGALVLLQLFLFRHMRRIVNPPLVIATLLTVLCSVLLAHTFVAARESLRIAKEDAFDSVHSLVRARTLAYDANGDESRFLLDDSSTRGLDAAFRGKVTLLTTTPTERAPSREELEAGKRRATSTKREAGLFWDELHNITFEGELSAATRMVEAFRDYMTIDARIRKLAAAGKVDEAIELCIGDRVDESNAAFARFDAALQATLDINRSAFDREILTTSSGLRRAETMCILLAACIAFLTWLGVRPRLREYQ